MKDKRINNADLFSQPSLLILPRVPILVGGHCKKILTVKFLYKNGAKI